MSPPDPFWFAAAFPLLWVAVTGGISLMSGWHSLADRFRSSEAIEGETFRFRSASMGWRFFPANYNGCLFSTVGARGFSLSLFFPFRFLHPRLVIPWAAVASCTHERLLMIDKVTIHIRDFDRRLRIRGSLGIRILQDWQRYRAVAV